MFVRGLLLILCQGMVADFSRWFFGRILTVVPFMYCLFSYDKIPTFYVCFFSSIL